MYLDGERLRLPDKDVLSAVGVVADVRLQAVMWGSRAITTAVMDACPNPIHAWSSRRLAGIAVRALRIEGFEEIERDGYLRQCWLCREPRK